jgi:hypothetical protein
MSETTTKPVSQTLFSKGSLTMNRTPAARPATKTVLSLSALALLITGAVLYAGPLNPPVGPVASTHKTLIEVEPRIAVNATNTPGDPLGDPSPSLFKITQPGSYYLTGNITGVVGKHGIEIASSGVTLDLMGFDLVGVPAMGVLDGVSVTMNSLTNIAVVNGSVRNWGQDGVNLGAFSASGCRVEDIASSGNGRIGVFAGNGSRIFRCFASGGQYGLYGSTSCIFVGSSATGASVSGFWCGSGTVISDCSAFDNAGVGITASVTTVTNSAAYSNGGNGMNIGAGSAVSNCVAYANSGTGFTATSGTTIVDCTARSNTLDGILCSSACIIRGNICSINGNGTGDGANIHATGSDNRIEGNNCSVADRGIDVDLAGNIIIKNTCAGNTTDWVIAANNVFGPIIDRRAPASAAVSGFAAASSLGSTDSNANFSY